jgi:hypothetical protein
VGSEARLDVLEKRKTASLPGIGLPARSLVVMPTELPRLLLLLGLIRTITFSFSIINSPLMLYISLVRSKLEYASVACNAVTITDSNKLECIQRKFAALCHNRFLFPDVEYHYGNILEKLNLQTLHIRRRHFDALFLINVFSGTKHCPPTLEIVGIRVPTRNMRSVAPSATALQLDVFLLQTVSVVSVYFVLCCLIAAAVCIRADSIIGHWLLSSARK